MPTNPPIVTIITPFYNASSFLDAFISSIKAQVFSDWSCILIDDNNCNTDYRMAAALIGGDNRFILTKNCLKKTRSGPASARNYGLMLARTELIAFCDVDDIWHPQKLQYQIDFHLLNQLDLSVSAYARFKNKDKRNMIVEYICPPLDIRPTKNALLARNFIPMLTVVVSRKIIHHKFTEVPHEDFLFWIQLFEHTPTLRYGCLQKVLAYYYVHASSISSRKYIVPFWAYNIFRRSGESRLSSIKALLAWSLNHIPRLLFVQAPPPRYTVEASQKLQPFDMKNSTRRHFQSPEL